MHMRCLFVPIAVATLLIGGVALCGQTSAQASGGAAMVFTPTELRHLQILGPWPPPTRTDPSNRVSCQPRAVELGRRLFRDPRMSPVGYIACVTCHQPDRAFTDLKARAHGLADLPRNTPSLFNLSHQINMAQAAQGQPARVLPAVEKTYASINIAINLYYSRVRALKNSKNSPNFSWRAKLTIFLLHLWLSDFKIELTSK